MTLNQSIVLSKMKEPIYLCTWNDGEIVEIHTEETLKKDYVGTNLFETTEHKLVSNSNFNWCQIIPTKSDEKAKNIQEVFDYFKKQEYGGIGETWLHDNMELQRIKWKNN